MFKGIIWLNLRKFQNFLNFIIRFLTINYLHKQSISIHINLKKTDKKQILFQITDK